MKHNRTENEWTHEHYVTNFLFLFSPEVKMRCSYSSAPGGLHDSTMAIWSSIYNHTETVYCAMGKKLVVDSTFASSKSHSMINSHQNNVDMNANPHQRCDLNCQAASARQLSEW